MVHHQTKAPRGLGRHRPAWLAEATLPQWGPLTENLRADVCVVGAGIAGLTTAYLLSQEGRQVVLLDAAQPASGETQHTSAHLASVIDDRFYEMIRLHGLQGAQLAARSHAEAIRRIEKIVETEEIACDFLRVPGYLFLGEDQGLDLLDRELEAVQQLGLREVRALDRVPGTGFELGSCLCFPNQGQFQPLRYLQGLAQAFVESGGRAFGDSHVACYEPQPDAEWPVIVKTDGGATVECAALVLATNALFSKLHRVHFEQTAYRTYVVAGRIPAGSVPVALYWDTGDPYHYIRVQPGVAEGEDLLIVGGEDHRTGHAEEPEARWAALAEWGRSRFPMLGQIVWHWSGQVLEPIDGLAYIGRMNGEADPVYVITGDSGMGLTHGTLGAMLISDLIAGRENPWATLYDPLRTPFETALKNGGELVNEAVHMAAGYTDWLTPGEVDHEEEIAPGSGAVMREGLTKHAVYRDKQGIVHRLSAVCPHLGGLVRWNSAEHTWDCPCHGSRFTARGEVLNGPSPKPLSPVEPPDAS